MEKMFAVIAGRGAHVGRFRAKSMQWG